MRVAVVGSGVAGLVSAHLLDPRHDVTVFEAGPRLGGHVNTVTVDDPTAGPLEIDTGFIVHNRRNYPNLVRLFEDLGVNTQPSEMSFAVSDRLSRFTYRATDLNSLLARRRNLVDPRMWRMTADILRFWKAGKALLDERTADPGDDEPSVGRFLADGGYSEEFVTLHFVPMIAAVWSADPASIDDFPAPALLRFLDNHGLLGLRNRPEWRTVTGGARTYVDEIVRRFGGEIRTSSPVETVARTPAGVVISSRHGTEDFDHVVLACHTDQALELLVDAEPDEKEILGAVGFQPNRATLHTDVSVLPPVRRAWAAWNYDRVDHPAGAATVTYDLTTLQRLPGERRYLVSLNQDDRIDPDAVLARFEYSHPVFDRSALEAQRRLPEINGYNHTHFCGAWAGYGFHEDGVVSALTVCRDLGVRW